MVVTIFDLCLISSNLKITFVQFEHVITLHFAHFFLVFTTNFLTQLLVILNLPLVGLWVQLLKIPTPWLYAGILMFAAAAAVWRA